MNQNIKLKGVLKRYALMPLLFTVLLVGMDAMMYYFNILSGIIGSVIVIVYFGFAMFLYRRNTSVIFEELVDFATQYGTVQKQLVEELEVPYAMLDHNCKMLWMNNKFAEITGKNRHYRKSITSIFPELTREILHKDKNYECRLEYNDRVYRAHVIMADFTEMMDENAVFDVEKSEQYLYVVYLFDETQLYKLEVENDELQMVSGLVYIDNYDEVLEAVDEVRRSLIVALVDRKVSKYFAQVHGIIKKTENDKYFVVFQRKYLDQMIENKFSVLDEVKSVKKDNEMAMTLSIGLGSCGNDYSKNHDFARMAIDLALGRGGDQVVLKEKDKTSYYGGKNRQVERTTRVKARVKALALREIMSTADEFYVMGHSLADVDCFGAAVGIFCAARQLGKTAHIIIDEVNNTLKPVKDCFSVENGYPEDMFMSSLEAVDEYEPGCPLIVVDVNKTGYTECPSILSKARPIVVFDHHRQTEDFIKNTVLSYIEPYASSACEMIAEVLQYFDENIELSTAEANALYAGILIDTNNFVTNTGVRTFEAAAYLRRCGADVALVRKMLRNSMQAYKARAEAVRRAEVFRNDFAISVCPSENLVSPTVVCAQAANELLDVAGIKASFVMTEYKNKVFISARSIDEVNVQLIMERLGGGGHMNVAGAQLEDITISEARWKLQNLINELIKKGDLI